MRNIYYITAGWCSGCKQLNPIMEQIGKHIQVNKIDVEYEPDVQRKFNVQSVPTVILVENEQEIKRFVGTKSYEQVLNWINS